MLRPFLFLGLLLPFAAHAQYHITLENGRRFASGTLAEAADSLTTDSGGVAKRDVLLLTVKGTDHVFNVVAGEKRKVKLKESCRVCRAGRLYGAKYAGSGLDPEGFSPALAPGLLNDTLFIRFYRNELAGQGIYTDKKGHILGPETAKAEPASRGPVRAFTLGPYWIMLVKGDTLTTKEYVVQGDSLKPGNGSRIHLKEIALIWSTRDRCVYTYPEYDRARIWNEGSDACTMAYICAERFEESSMAFDSLPIPAKWRSDTTFLPCYRAALGEKAILTEENGDRVPDTVEGTGGVPIGAPSQIIFYTGDTLFLKKEFYMKDDMLCAYGGNCWPTRSILLFRTVKGQFYFKPSVRGKRRLDPPIADMSTGAKGRLYANLLFANCVSWEDADIPSELRDHEGFLVAYRSEVVRLVMNAERLRKRANTMRVVSGALTGFNAGAAPGAALGAGLGGAMAIPPHERPYYGTPMPPE